MLYGAKHGESGSGPCRLIESVSQVWETLKHYREATISPHFLNHVTSAYDHCLLTHQHLSKEGGSC